MKKVLAFIFILVVFYGELSFVDLSEYTSQFKKVEVKGEVKHPGVYEVAHDAIVKDIIALAGGVSKQGDLSSVNQTLNIENGAVISIPKVSEVKQISINTATLEELDSLTGIGPSIAKRIIEYRQTKPFRKLEDLKNVKGIGDKLLLRIKDLICL